MWTLDDVVVYVHSEKQLPTPFPPKLSKSPRPTPKYTRLGG